MYVLGICSHWNQFRIDRDHLSELRLDLDDFSLFFGIFGSYLAYLSPQVTLNTMKYVFTMLLCMFLITVVIESNKG